MTAKRGPAAAPAIDGYRYVQPLGSGGFADVYLYEQDRPRRKVAVKVLLSDLKTDGARRRFESEANLMAQLSTHPFIVTIYEANVSTSGHSYLAMEYWSKPNLDARMRRQRFSVDEALAVGIQVASAVETAHRAGIAHRDIKPANILVTDYNRPALTDFGISGTMDSAAADDGGMSIPWSPPESFGSADADGVMVDVWALGATIYTLLAGHSPFALPGGNNSREMMSRIASMPLPGLGRIDIPQSLQQVLAVAMAKQPSSRYQSAHALGLALQRIQVELGLSVTSFEVLDDGPDADHPDDAPEDATRIRGVVSIDPRASTTNTGSSVRASVSSWAQQPTLPRNGMPKAGVPQAGPPQTGVPQAPDEATVARATGSRTGAVAPAGVPPSNVPAGWDRPAPFTPVPVEDTQLRPAALEPDAEAASGVEPGDARRRPKWLLLAAGGVLAATAVTGMVVVNGAGAPAPAPQTKPSVDGPLDAIAPGSVVPAPAKLAGTKAGSSVTFTWENPAPAEGEVYMWRPVSVLQAGEYTSSREAQAVVAASPDAATCVEVVIRRGNGQASPEPAKACVP
ncbi:protein kinase [Pseudarthrobacter psychrotolerans]|uniref:non-specific serine/threonine protein kinase n=1 Tax=Pseudarthrobacter psychrotolerans TaxID=2697569 RepID=A0A6P1NHR3_9MICC|nr:serine/threonine-protein kinase [Pseudarthrobacter psychrotolerans]QHK20155.1 protein kinase [Pseudarthrobacter psychrotolerans]